MKLFEVAMTSMSSEKLASWKAAVVHAYPQFASQLTYRGFTENGTSLITAEVRKGDRCLGIFDIKTEEGVILE